jgi:uncharacterized protein (TIGR02145 family)
MRAIKRKIELYPKKPDMKKQNKILIYPFAIMGVFLMSVNSCNNDDDITPSNVTDIDGNVYHTVTIGTQTWMSENLKVTRYRNGDTIGTTNPATSDIADEDIPKYQWSYNGNESNAETYGRLYTWFTIADSRCLCPTGWHVPTITEWDTLTDFLTNNNYGYQGGGDDIGKALAATSGWDTDTTAGAIGNDQASNNSSGFNGLPGGKRGSNGIFNYLGIESKWWSSTEFDDGAWGRSLSNFEGGVSKTIAGKDDGRSIRCLKDQTF